MKVDRQIGETRAENMSDLNTADANLNSVLLVRTGTYYLLDCIYFFTEWKRTHRGRVASVNRAG